MTMGDNKIVGAQTCDVQDNHSTVPDAMNVGCHIVQTHIEVFVDIVIVSASNGYILGQQSWVEYEPSSKKTEADTKKVAQMQEATKSRADMEKKSDVCISSAIMTLIDSGSTVKAMILDVVKKERLVDLSLKPMLHKRYVQKDLEVHQTANAVVEIVFGAESSSFHGMN
ncbi:hypothetical protein Tco_1352333 [Tanacetum coccineum]